MSWETRKVEFGLHQGKTWKALVEEHPNKIRYVENSWISERDPAIKCDLGDVLVYAKTFHKTSYAPRTFGANAETSIDNAVLVVELNDQLEAKGHEVRELKRILEEKASEIELMAIKLKCRDEASEDPQPYKDKFLKARDLLYTREDMISHCECQLNVLRPKGVLIDQMNAVRKAEGKAPLVLPAEVKDIERDSKVINARIMELADL